MSYAARNEMLMLAGLARMSAFFAGPGIFDVALDLISRFYDLMFDLRRFSTHQRPFPRSVNIFPDILQT